jgi:hypothetical protein
LLQAEIEQLKEQMAELRALVASQAKATVSLLIERLCWC